MNKNMEEKGAGGVYMAGVREQRMMMEGGGMESRREKKREKKRETERKKRRPKDISRNINDK